MAPTGNFATECLNTVPVQAPSTVDATAKAPPSPLLDLNMETSLVVTTPIPGNQVSLFHTLGGKMRGTGLIRVTNNQSHRGELPIGEIAVGIR